ncbi:hypothetical protein Q8A73_017173 [Channa argus]|nr:hypothetical protein Q8A73_017173 [Channa argus]
MCANRTQPDLTSTGSQDECFTVKDKSRENQRAHLATMYLHRLIQHPVVSLFFPGVGEVTNVEQALIPPCWARAVLVGGKYYTVLDMLPTPAHHARCCCGLSVCLCGACVAKALLQAVKASRGQAVM